MVTMVGYGQHKPEESEIGALQVGLSLRTFLMKTFVKLARRHLKICPRTTNLCPSTK